MKIIFLMVVAKAAILIERLNEKQYFDDIPLGYVELKVKSSILTP